MRDCNASATTLSALLDCIDKHKEHRLEPGSHYDMPVVQHLRADLLLMQVHPLPSVQAPFTNHKTPEYEAK